MTLEAWLTLGVTVVIFVALARNFAPPDVLFLGATALLALCGIITPSEAFSGFANPGVLTVAVLFVGIYVHDCVMVTRSSDPWFVNDLYFRAPIASNVYYSSTSHASYLSGLLAFLPFLLFVP